LAAALSLTHRGPGEFPVQGPNRFELVMNLKTAKVLGLAVPRWLRARADEMIE
jgi:putative ABC transport system substrate-binding protein